MRTIGPCSLALAMLTLVSGCMTGPHIFQNDDPYSCEEPGSPEWWAQKAQITPGVRRKCKKGKVWPARPRPSGEPQQFCHTFHSEHYWPLPYVCQDRQYVKDILEVQMSNGWVEETTLYDRHFSQQDQTLTRPGQLHLLRIVEETPLERRAVYVQTTYDPALDEARLSIVQNAVSELTGGQTVVPVSIRKGREHGRPASEVQIINGLYNGSIPSPRLGGGGSASSGGGGAAAAPTTSGP